METTTAKNLFSKKDGSILILDIRKTSDFNDWHIKDSQNIDVSKDIWDGNFDKAKEKLIKLPKGKKIVIV